VITVRKLSTEKRAMILGALCEGNRVNATVRLFGCSKITVLRLLADAGTFCEAHHDEHVRASVRSYPSRRYLGHSGLDGPGRHAGGQRGGLRLDVDHD